MASIRDWIGNIFNRKQKIANAPSSGRNVDPKKIRIKRVGYAFVRGGGGGGGRAQFEGPDFSLEDVESAYNTDGIVRQALDKYTELMFKAGWVLYSKNEKALEYIRLRLAAMAMSTGQPTDEFFVEVADNLVKYANVFIVKARQKGSNAGYQIPGVSARGITGKDPIAGYFVLPVTTIEIARDINGVIKKYQQKVPGANKPLEFNPEDVIHIHYKKPTGRGFGVPFTIPVLDDVRLLREVEENIARLIYRHLHPLYMYQVGLPQAGFEATEEEIEAVREEIEDMPTDGGIVLPERHKIEAIGAEGEALDAHEYLAHYERRVFTGLGVSEVVMGRGNTANRSTADNMTTEMHDRIKALQKVYSIGINNFIIDELLMEGGFDPIANPDDDVEFRFKEIALDEKIKLENHEVLKFTQNAQTFEEMRNNIGEDPVVDENRLFFNMIQKAMAEHQAQVDAAKDVQNRNTPTNQHGTKTSPKKNAAAADYNLAESHHKKGLGIREYSRKLSSHYDAAREDIVQLIKQYYKKGDRRFPNFEPKEIEMIIHLTKDAMNNTASQYVKNAFVKGVSDARKELKVERLGNLDQSLYIRTLQGKAEKDIERVLEKLTKVITRVIRKSDNNDAISKVVSAFKALEYRLDFIATTELIKSYNYGFALAGQSLDRDQVFVTISEHESGCEECKEMDKEAIKLTGELYNKIPPWHPNCTCQLTFKKPV